MKITFLGTGTSQGIPLIACKCKVCLSDDLKDKRLRSSVLVEFNNKTIVIDTGPDFRQQMLSNKVNRLDAVLYTHEHKDHIAGLDDIRAFNYVLKKKIDLYGSANVFNAIKREFHYIFDEFKYPGIPEINFHEITNDSFVAEEITIIPISVFHYKLPVFGFRIGDFTYITDANHIPDSEKEKIKGSKVLVLNALRREKHISHFTFDEAIALSKELKCGHTYFTHISHQLGKHIDVQSELPDGISLAFDGQQIIL